MSKARELLKKVLERNAEGYLDFCGMDALKNEIKELLDEPEQEQEPVAWKDRTYGNLHHVDWGDSMPLYALPPKREPLSDDEITQVTKGMSEFGADMFKAGIKAAEKAHGIGGEK